MVEAIVAFTSKLSEILGVPSVDRGARPLESNNAGNGATVRRNNVVDMTAYKHKKRSWAPFIS
jgi:hypothetical protein